MKLNKTLIFLILFFSFAFSVRATSLPAESSELKYDVETMKVNLNYISFSGWARKTANSTGDHNVGGKNLRIFIAAVDGDKLKNSLKDIYNTLETMNASGLGYYNDKNDDDVNYILRETNKYSNGNKLYGSLCLRECSNSCCEYPRNNYTFKSLKNSSVGSEGPSSCNNFDSGSTSTCESYNTGFSIKFNFDDLNKLLVNLDQGQEKQIKFYIFIIHNKIKYNSSVLNKFTFEKNEKKVYYRPLAVYENNCDGCNGVNNLFRDIKLDLGKSFVVLGHDYRLIKKEGDKLEPINRNYFSPYSEFSDKCGEDGDCLKKCLNGEKKNCFESTSSSSISCSGGCNVFEIDGNVVQINAPDAGLKGLVSAEEYINMYKLKVGNKIKFYNSYGGSRTVYIPGEDESYYAYSSWGTVSGVTTLTMRVPASKPEEDCNTIKDTVSCTDKTISGVCKKYNYIDLGAGLFINNNVSFPYQLKVYKGYSSSEFWELTDNYYDSKFNNNNILIENGRYFRFGLSLEKKSSTSLRYLDEYIYEITLTGQEPMYVPQSLLIDFIKNNNSIINDDHKNAIMYPQLLDEWPDLNKSINNVNVSYNSFFNSNYLDKTYDNYMVDSVSGNTINIAPKKACIVNTTSIINYRDGECNQDEETAASRYSIFVPFGFKGLTENPSVELDMTGSSYLIDKITYNLCPLKGIDGKIDKYRYRVIDLKDPFPNNEPASGGRASNWFELWNNRNSNEFLHNRRYDDGIEKYLANLNSVNINNIRNYNKSASNKIYLDSKISINGVSSYMDGNDIFSSFNVEKYKPGTKEVAP